MKKLLLICMLMPLVSIAQKKTQAERQKILDEKRNGPAIKARDTLNYPHAYCMLIATGKLFSNKVDIKVDYGQDATFFEDTSIRDKNGKKITFYSVMDALNYMKHLGWNFKDAYSVTLNGQNVYHYLFENNGNAEIPITGRDND